ncbi:uncharacterized protein LOC129602506 [Paramacrobiotus metropolitanus]|uniref:uncharacterized protein LOC129602506 n=1 Tax=Paramacrobiotus metropolitanus TaxID=2943436 RepID=UPI0024460896|nr:uncharacterized protein LOC129602506 [Paramacrobiotus metropolitanus]
MTFLVYGADGWIGKAVVNVLLASGDTVLKGRRVITIDDVLKDLEKHQPDFVICSLGRIGTPALPTADYLEQKGKLLENITCNMSAPLFIAQATQLQGSIPMLYIGTGCIFEYDDDHPIGSVGFAENEAPNFFAASYSLVKSQTDQIMKNFPHVMTARIRLPVVLDAHPRDLVTKLLTYKKIHSVPNSVTVLPDILPVLIGSLITGKRGVINAVNPGVVDHATIIRIFEAQTGKKHEHELVTSDQLKTVLLAGRSNTALKTDLITEWIRDMPAMIRKKYAISDKLLDIKERITDIITTRAKFNVTPDRERRF